jgi:hypothetical protein
MCATGVGRNMDSYITRKQVQVHLDTKKGGSRVDSEIDDESQYFGKVVHT